MRVRGKVLQARNLWAAFLTDTRDCREASLLLPGLRDIRRFSSQCPPVGNNHPALSVLNLHNFFRVTHGQIMNTFKTFMQRAIYQYYLAFKSSRQIVVFIGQRKRVLFRPANLFNCVRLLVKSREDVVPRGRQLLTAHFRNYIFAIFWREQIESLKDHSANL